MFSEKVKILILISLCTIISLSGNSQNTDEKVERNETLEKGIQILKKYFIQEPTWQATQNSIKKDVTGLLNFIEDEPVDIIISNINNSFKRDGNYVYRLPEDVTDSLTIPGFYPFSLVERDLERIGIQLQSEFQNKQIVIPEHLMVNLDQKLNLIPKEKGIRLFTDSLFIMPDSLIIPEVIPDSLLNSPENFELLRIKDSLRTRYIERMVRYYNDSIVTGYVDSLTQEIRTRQFEEEYNHRKISLTDSVKLNNLSVIRSYNDSIVSIVNDSITAVLKTLIDYADYIDTTHISIINLTGESTDVRLQNKIERFSRVWLKNEQNDSLGILVKNTGKRSMQMLIDDGVTFSRYKPKDTKDFDFETLEKKISDMKKVGKSYEHETPWRIGGDGNAGFTQTYLQNWKKGGQSALSLLLILKGFANYSRSDGKVKWENSAEIRNGWIKPGGKDSELQKNDDKFEITSRYGISAFKKWYYSAEFNYETQFFRGYRYPTKTFPDPISSFLAPGKMFMKLGLEYKPKKEFSLLLSPLTLKNVYVRDTSLIDQTKFGVGKDKKSFWEPGLNADIKFQKEISTDITYETKYKMFINYKEPFKKFDINWENVLLMRLTDYVNMRFMLHFIYDDDVLFPVEDKNGVTVQKPRLQLKEFFTIGFVYKINRNVVRAKRIR